MSLKFWLGALVFFCCSIAISLNLLIFTPVYRLAFSSKKLSVYIIAFFNIITDLWILSILAMYLSVSIMADRYIIAGEAGNFWSVLISGIWFCAWFMECLVQVVMAANRLVVITFQMYNVFTYRFTILVFFIVLACAATATFIDQAVFPCCVFIMDHEVLSFRFLTVDGVYNYSNIVLMFFNLFGTITPSICYVIVFITIRLSGAKVATHVSQDRKKQDIRYLIQFVSISIFYIFTWISFESLPYIVPSGRVEWYVMVSILVILNSSSNSVIYLSVNREVQRTLPVPWLRHRLTKNVHNSTTGMGAAVNN